MCMENVYTEMINISEREERVVDRVQSRIGRAFRNYCIACLTIEASDDLVHTSIRSAASWATLLWLN